VTGARVLTQADIQRRIAVFNILSRGQPYPGQRYRHGWIPVAGVGILGKSYSQPELERTYGDAVDSDEFAPGAIVELGTSGDIHIDIASDAEDRWHVFGDMSQDDDFPPKLLDAIAWAADIRLDTPGHRPPDPVNGLTDWQEVEGVIVGYAPDGTIRIGWPHGDDQFNVMDLTRDEALALHGALDELLVTDLPDPEDEDE
jgi:hypothetical protein